MVGNSINGLNSNEFLFRGQSTQTHVEEIENALTQNIYLPLVYQDYYRSASVGTRVNIPFSPGEVILEEAGLFWFGNVNATQNYVDVRIGYNSQELLVHIAVFDRLVWYDASPSRDDLDAWDALTVYIDTNGNEDPSPHKSAYRFTGQVNWWEDRRSYQIADRGDGSEWEQIYVPFETESGFRGGLNDLKQDNGWRMTYHIPFSSLGLGSEPNPGSIWGLALELHDRDDAQGSSIPNTNWPTDMNSLKPASWGQLAFGLPEFHPPAIPPEGSLVIRHGLNNAQVADGEVGGGTDCGSGLDLYTEWGDTNYSGFDKINVQNQYDLADWACFSKIYITFPLEAIPPNKSILSAKLTLYQFGNSGEGQIDPPPSSLIQVFTVGDDWLEQTLTWNNAPLAKENVSRSWVGWLSQQPPWPGVARTWDVSMAMREAYQAGVPLRLALYSADSARHSGKYFTSSDTGDWNSQGRPTLVITWGK